jgi:hypothetical protein
VYQPTRQFTPNSSYLIRNDLPTYGGFTASCFDPARNERFDARRRQSRDALEKENHHETQYGTRIFCGNLDLDGQRLRTCQAPRFTVPFDFTVGNQVFPAGTYQVSYSATKTAILIRSQDDDLFHAFATAYPADPSTSGGKVTFTKYGNQYFLHEVLCSALSMNAALPTSRLEKRARIQEAQLPHSETVAALRTGAK